MQLGGVHELVDQIDTLSRTACSREDARAGVACVYRLRAWLDACELSLTRRLESLSPAAEVDLAEAGRCSVGAASRIAGRAKTAAQAPRLEAALADGDISGAHLDALTSALRQVEAPQRERLAQRADQLAPVATRSSAVEFGDRLRDEARLLESGDGMDRRASRRRATRMRAWFDRQTGMFRIAGEFDPETGQLLDAALEAQLAVRHAQETPVDCPSDPIERQAWLRAHALMDLIQGGGLRVTCPEFIAVIDARVATADGAPVVDWGLPVDLPRSVLLEHFEQAKVWPIVLVNGVVVHADGELNLDRSSRLANTPQRRALRGLHSTCGVPGCDVRFSNCKIHHVHWWEHGGLTNLDNLLPLCARHHHAVHDLGWTLTLNPDRSVAWHPPPGEAAA